MSTPSFGLNPLDAERRRLERRRALVDLLQKQAMTGPEAPTMPGAQMSPYQGLAKMGEALIAALANRAQEKREKEFAGKELEQRQAQMDAFAKAVFPSGEGAAMPVKPETYTPTDVREMNNFVGPPMPTPPPGMDMARVLALQAPMVQPPQNIGQPSMLKNLAPPPVQYGPPSPSQQREMMTPRPTAPAMPMPTQQPEIAAQAPAPTAQQMQAPAPVSGADWTRKAVQALGSRISSDQSLVDVQRKALSAALASPDPRLGNFMLDSIQQGNKDLQAMRRVMYEAQAKAKQAEIDAETGRISQERKFELQALADEKQQAFTAAQNDENRRVTLLGQANTANIEAAKLIAKSAEEDRQMEFKAREGQKDRNAALARTLISSGDKDAYSKAPGTVQSSALNSAKNVNMISEAIDLLSKQNQGLSLENILTPQRFKTDQDVVNLQSILGRINAMQIVDVAGRAQNANEMKNINMFIPNMSSSWFGAQSDTTESAITKLKNLLNYEQKNLDFISGTYGFAPKTFESTTLPTLEEVNAERDRRKREGSKNGKQ